MTTMRSAVFCAFFYLARSGPIESVASVAGSSLRLWAVREGIAEEAVTTTTQRGGQDGRNKALNIFAWKEGTAEVDLK